MIKNTHARNAHIQHRTAAFSVQKIMLARKDAEIAKLQSQVEELKGSAPGGVKRPGGVAPAGGEDDMEVWNKELKAAVQPE